MSERSSQVAKIAVVVLLLGLAGGLFWRNLRTESPIPDSFQYVDATTGKLYRISRPKAPAVLPGENPDTKEKTLIPVLLGDDGQYYVTDRKMSAVRELGDRNKVIDVKTRRVTVSK